VLVCFFFQSKVSDPQKEELKEVYSIFDKDGNGSLSAKELANVLKDFGENPSQEELNDIVVEVTKSKTTTIDFGQFVEVMTKSSSEEQELRETFRVLDADSNGSISFFELKRAMEIIGEDLSDHEVQLMIQEVDPDGSGLVDFDKFCKLMKA